MKKASFFFLSTATCSCFSVLPRHHSKFSNSTRRRVLHEGRERWTFLQKLMMHGNDMAKKVSKRGATGLAMHLESKASKPKPLLQVNKWAKPMHHGALGISYANAIFWQIHFLLIDVPSIEKEEGEGMKGLVNLR